MITILASKIRVFVLAALLGMALCFLSPTYAVSGAFIVDLNSKEITPIGPLGGSARFPYGINEPVKWWVHPRQLEG